MEEKLLPRAQVVLAGACLGVLAGELGRHLVRVLFDQLDIIHPNPLNLVLLVSGQVWYPIARQGLEVIGFCNNATAPAENCASAASFARRLGATNMILASPPCSLISSAAK